MPKMRRLDDSQGHPTQQTQEGVCERSSLLDARTVRGSGPWPFKYTLQNGHWYVAKGQRTRKTSQDLVQEVGSALV